MANSTSNIDKITSNQASKEVTANAFFDAASVATLYARRASTSGGLIWGYYGGNVIKSDGVLVQIAEGTLTLTASTTCYIVAQKSDGVVSFGTATTNWNDRENYWRLYSVVTSTAGVSSYTDSRELGAMTGMRSGFVKPVIETASFTLGANENEVICNGTGTITITFPAASSWPGRKVRVKTIAAFTVVSASSNVKPISTNTAGTAILAATAGKWAELVSDGTNWVVMATG